MPQVSIAGILQQQNINRTLLAVFQKAALDGGGTSDDLNAECARHERNR